MEIKKAFTENGFSYFTCPHCMRGNLEAKKVIVIESNESRILQKNPEWEPCWVSGVFHAALECTSGSCAETVVCIGDYVYDWVDKWEDNEPSGDYQPYYSPRFFYPNLKLFKVPERVPEKISNVLDESFSLFFCNPSSAANMARIALEKTLDHLKVRTFSSKTGKRNRLSLHNRLDHLPDKFSEEKHLFEAIKWLGNAGSHDNKGIDHKSLELCYAIFEKLLIKIFSTENEKIDKLAKEVNKRKGPIKSRK